MTKDVMISIRGLQFMDDDSDDEIETLQRGQYYEKNCSRFLIFDEYMEGFKEPAKNVMRFKEKEMTLTKRGLINVQLDFEEGKKNLTSYRTPYGVMMLGVDTRRISLEETPDELTLKIDYVLEANYEFVADCQISVCARSVGSSQEAFHE